MIFKNCQLVNFRMKVSEVATNQAHKLLTAWRPHPRAYGKHTKNSLGGFVTLLFFGITSN
jgi:hypothetical protein